MAGLNYGELDHTLGYLLRRAQLAGFQAFHEATAGMDISPARYTAMVIVGANPGLTQTRLGQALGTARSGAMMVANWMEERGLAERRPREDDARAWGLFLTPHGEAELQRLCDRVRVHDGRFASRLTSGELGELKRLLEKLSA